MISKFFSNDIRVFFVQIWLSWMINVSGDDNLCIDFQHLLIALLSEKIVS